MANFLITELNSFDYSNQSKYANKIYFQMPKLGLSLFLQLDKHERQTIHPGYQ